MAPLLGAGATPALFDHIECGGVIHHTADPPRALAQLAAVLRPGGSLHLGLYASRADAHTKLPVQRLARRWRGALDSDAGIRQFRRDLLLMSNEALCADAGGSGSANASAVAACVADAAASRPHGQLGWGDTHRQDFASLSGVRDLLFHEHERGYTVAQVGALLRGAGLRFRGVDTAHDTLRRFKRRFPAARSERSLADWELFESEQPLTFRFMLRVWAQKPPGEYE